MGRKEYEIPVRIRKGTWQALIPHDIPSWLIAAVGAGATAYVVTAAQKMADNDFDEVGIRQIFQKALEGIQWTIRIGKHLGTLVKQPFDNVKWRQRNLSSRLKQPL